MLMLKKPSNTDIFWILILLASMLGVIGIYSAILYKNDPQANIFLELTKNIGPAIVLAFIIIIISYILFVLIGLPKIRSNYNRLDDIVQNPGIPDDVQNKYYTFIGIREKLRSDNTYQDFNIKRPNGNINSVHLLWADTYTGSTINARVDSRQNFLQIQFVNEANSFPCNISIRPENEYALCNKKGRRFIKYEARLSKTKSSTDLSKIAITYRVSNRYLQSWKWCMPEGEYLYDTIDSTQWNDYYIDLNSEYWNLFTPGGNYLFGPKKPVFDVICALVFEFGSINKSGRLGQGAGLFDIRNIKLVSEIQD